MTTDPSSPELPVSLEGAPETLGAQLTRMVNEVIGEQIPPAATLEVHARPDGESITLDCATGVRLSEASDEAATAVLLLKLCACLDDAGLRIGVTGEYDDVHLYRMLPTADLAAAELADMARSLQRRAAGLQQLIA